MVELASALTRTRSRRGYLCWRFLLLGPEHAPAHNRETVWGEGREGKHGRLRCHLESELRVVAHVVSVDGGPWRAHVPAVMRYLARTRSIMTATGDVSASGLPSGARKAPDSTPSQARGSATQMSTT